MISIQDLQAGARVRLSDSRVVHVVDNPRDGLWLVVGPDDADNDTSTEMVHVDDVKEVIE
jgi:hypothetical protein